MEELGEVRDGPGAAGQSPGAKDPPGPRRPPPAGATAYHRRQNLRHADGRDLRAAPASRRPPCSPRRHHPSHLDPPSPPPSSGLHPHRKEGPPPRRPQIRPWPLRIQRLHLPPPRRTARADEPRRRI
ncbi:unnamed protein product [Urochloa humidicola]